MSSVTHPRLHHLALTVTDLDVSVRWYESVFGGTFLMDAPHQGGVGRGLANENRELMIGLHRHDTNGGELFGETSTGLDHAPFVVPPRADLQPCQDRLEVLVVTMADTADK